MTVSVEVAAIREFLAGCPPFDELPAEMLGRAASKVQIAYYRAGDPGAVLDYSSPRLYVVRTGAFEVRDSEGQLLDRVEPGGYFGYPSVADRRRYHQPADSD